jgi:hypothetical protein
MNKIVYYTLLIASLIAIPFFLYALLNTMVSLQYEIEGPNNCISGVSGQDLCFMFKLYAELVIFSFLGFVGLLVFRKKLIRQRITNSSEDNQTL